jgi:hypothetical protein
MGYRQLINSNLDLAFRLLGDLAVDTELVSRDTVSFDFSKGALRKSGSTSVPARVVVTEHEKLAREHNSARRQILMKTKDHADLGVYDTVILDGNPWKFGPVLQSDGYVTLAYVTREI